MLKRVRSARRPATPALKMFTWKIHFSGHGYNLDYVVFFYVFYFQVNKRNHFVPNVFFWYAFQTLSQDLWTEDLNKKKVAYDDEHGFSIN